MIGMEDINRLKLVLVEKKKQGNGWLNSWEKIHQLYLNGVPMYHGLIGLLFQE